MKLMIAKLNVFWKNKKIKVMFILLIRMNLLFFLYYLNLWFQFYFFLSGNDDKSFINDVSDIPLTKEVRENKDNKENKHNEKLLRLFSVPDLRESIKNNLSIFFVFFPFETKFQMRYSQWISPTHRNRRLFLKLK